MRVDATSHTNLLSALTGLNNRQSEIANELSSGVRLNHLSDDPVSTGQAVTLADALRRGDAFVASSATAGNRLQAADTALTSAVTQLTSAVSTAIGAYDGSTSSSARAVAVQQLKGIRESLLSLANSSYSGTYLFSGSSTLQPFTQAGDGTVTYSGNSNGASLPLPSSESVQTSVAGSSVFLAADGSVFGTLNNLITNLSDPAGPGDGAVFVGDLRSSLSTVLKQRAALNTSQKRLSSESDYVTAQKVNLTVQQGTLLAADTASLATELSAVTSQRSALLSTIGLLQKGSLFDYL